MLYRITCGAILPVFAADAIVCQRQIRIIKTVLRVDQDNYQSATEWTNLLEIASSMSLVNNQSVRLEIGD